MGFVPVVCFAQMQNIFFSYSGETAQHCLLKQTQQFNKTLKWTTYCHPGSEISHLSFVQFPMAFMNHLFTSQVATMLIVH